MSKHTEGPWKWHRTFDSIVAENHSIICKIATGEDRAEEDANARLIAASPDLLAALKEMLVDYRACGMDGRQVCEVARAAVAKAEGIQ